MKSVFGRLSFIVFVFILSIVVFSGTASAQDLDYVTISGKITDSNKAALPGATVTATLTTTGVERTAVTNDDGVYQILKLEPGIYTVKFSSAGFGTKEQKDLVTIAGQNVQLNITLEPAGVSAEQTITINDEPPAVDTTRTVVGGTVTQREIEELPNNTRNPLDLIFTLGGVTEEPFSQRDLAQDKGNFRESAGNAYSTPEESGSFALSGGAAYSNNITIDGLDNNDDRSAGVRFTPSLDAISEVQVITNQFSAEYGRASGGRVNFRTRSGGKKFRGRVSYFFEDESLNANTWRNNSRGIARPARQEHIPVFSFGGPVPFGYFKKKTFFFAAYEYQNVREDALVDTYVPVAQNSRYPLPVSTDPSGVRDLGTGLLAPFVERVPTPLQNHTLSARLDHKFTNNHSINFNFQYGDRKDFRQFSGGTRLAEALVGNSRSTQGFSFTDDFVFSSKVVNQARFQYSTLKPQVVSDTSLTSPVVIITIPSALDRGTSLVAGSSTSGSTDREEKRWQIQDSLTAIAGSHTFRMGGDIQNVKSTYIDRGDATGTYSFASVTDFLNSNVTRYRHNFGNTSQLENTYASVFFQDEWRVKSNLTLSMGLRYENETIIDDKNNFAPRVGIAWNPFKDNKGVIRFGAGIFYNRALLRTIDDNRLTLVNEALVFDTGNLGTSTVPLSVFQTISSKFPNPLTESEVRQICTSNNLNCTAQGNFSNSIDPNIKLPESYQFNVGFEREIGKGFVVEANYTWNKTAHLWRRVSTNSVSLDILNARTGGNYSSLTDYLLATTFNNTAVNGVRPIYTATTSQNVVRFVTSFTPPPVGDPNRCSGTITPSNGLQGGCMRVNGVQTTFLNLNGPTPGTTSPQYAAALNALNQFRPNPNGLKDAKQIISAGNSEYSGLILELRQRYRKLGYGFGTSFRLAYTLSSLMDDGVVNTSQAQIAGDFSSEWARSLLDRRHRLAISGSIDTPYWMGKLRFSPILRYGSSAPFNISAGGIDRNLDDVSNDRPNYSGDINDLVYRNPGEPFPQALFDSLTQATLGMSGNLPRNAGRGPGLFIFDLNISRTFKFSERVSLRPNIEINNVFNSRVFSFGGAFINSTDPQTTFLVPTRTYRPREIRVGLRLDF
jgi:hypothetical protein